jgi:hypothetical protein
MNTFSPLPMGRAPTLDASIRDGQPVFHMHGVTKVSRMGEVEVHALR